MICVSSPFKLPHGLDLMSKKLIFLAFSCHLFNSVSSQNSTLLEGGVTDQRDAPLEYALVVAYGENNTFIGFDETDSLGWYQIVIPKGALPHELKCSKLGYYPSSIKLLVGQESSSHINLIQLKYHLLEVGGLI